MLGGAVRHLVFGSGAGNGSVGNAGGAYRQLTVLATATASAMIAQQVAGKAIRDALFLSTFYVKSLPAMMAGGAIASLAAVIILSRVLARRSPSDVLPVLFGTNALAIGAAFITFFRTPRISALIVYLAMAVLGPVILSTFWSVINEHFDPHSAKPAVARITAGATLGGVIGGLATWGLSRQLTLASAIGFLALLNLACVGGALTLRRTAANANAAHELDGAIDPAAPSSAAPALSPFTMLRRVPFLRALAALMALGSASSTLLDYTFSAKATQLLGGGPSLLAFFSLFGIAVSILSFIVQVTLGKVAIERLGLMANVAALQFLVAGGCVLALVAPGMSSVTVLRGAEMVHRNSLFKSAYELFYTPIPDARRRVTKAIIDVGFDRVGTVLGSGITLLVLWRSNREEVRLLWVVALIAIACLPIAKWLHAGYVATLAQDLREAAPRLADACPKPDEPESEMIIERIEAVRHPEDQTGSTRILHENADELAARASALLRGAPDEIESALSDWKPHHAVLVPLAAPLLAEPVLRGRTQAAIRSVARDAVGALTDIFLDTKVSFAVRRRVGPILATCRSQRAADGLIAALSDERLEVRYVAGRALLTITEGRGHGIVIAPELVARLVREELARVEEEIPDTKYDDDERQASLFDAIARVRVDRRLEHVFNILALAMDREPLRLAFRAIHHPNERHRGTALEYIQTVLPTDVRAPLWPMIAPGHELLPAPREAAEVLAELARLLDEPRAPSTT
jgi:hypothetical protein